MKRREIFAGNWKMYKTSDEARELIQGLLAGLSSLGEREVAVFPPAVYVREIVQQCKGTPIDVGVQNMYFEKEGAFTGELSPLMVKDSGCRYILIGHSERRHVFGENDEQVNKKVRSALEHGLEPVICVGELLEEREQGTTEKVLKEQVTGALSGIAREYLDSIIIAYEPVWAIGTGKVATPEMADEAHQLIRNILGGIYDKEKADSMPILYGGSVKPDNIRGLYDRENIDGVLVGGASLKAKSFLDIILV